MARRAACLLSGGEPRGLPQCHALTASSAVWRNRIMPFSTASIIAMSIHAAGYQLQAPIFDAEHRADMFTVGPFDCHLFLDLGSIGDGCLHSWFAAQDAA